MTELDIVAMYYNLLGVQISFIVDKAIKGKNDVCLACMKSAWVGSWKIVALGTGIDSWEWGGRITMALNYNWSFDIGDKNISDDQECILNWSYPEFGDQYCFDPIHHFVRQTPLSKLNHFV